MANYQFGDVTTKVGQTLTGDENYQFGDVTKSKMKTLTGDENYEWGDLSERLSSQAGKKASELVHSTGRKLTGDENYQLGDIRKTGVRKGKQGIEKIGRLFKKDYEFGDLKDGAKGLWNKLR